MPQAFAWGNGTLWGGDWEGLGDVFGSPRWEGWERYVLLLIFLVVTSLTILFFFLSFFLSFFLFLISFCRAALHLQKSKSKYLLSPVCCIFFIVTQRSCAETVVPINVGASHDGLPNWSYTPHGPYNYMTYTNGGVYGCNQYQVTSSRCASAVGPMSYTQNYVGNVAGISPMTPQMMA